MKISIAQRVRPFAHEPGIECLLPRTCWTVEAFPARLFLREEGARKIIDIPLHLHGPVREFTVQQDLEKGCVWVWGSAKEGHFRLRLQACSDAIQLWVDRAPLSGIECQDRLLKKRESISWKFSGPFREPAHIERLSLGSHRAQDWRSVWQRMDLKEILPILFHLSQWIPCVDQPPQSGMFRLLEESWDDFLRAAFSGLLTPRLIDDQYQGLLDLEDISPHASPCALIAKAGEKIRKLFIDQQEMSIELFSPQTFDCGRMTNIQLSKIGTLDLEWAKRSIQRAVLHVKSNAAIRMILPKSIASFRMRSSLNEKGRKISARDELSLQVGRYYLDRFQK